MITIKLPFTEFLKDGKITQLKIIINIDLRIELELVIGVKKPH